MLSKKLRDCLDQNRVQYQSIPHNLAYSSQETARCTHIPGREFSKTVLVKADGKLMMAVIPATQTLDLDLLRKNLHAKTLELAREDEVSSKFSDCESGAIPPFGNLYGMDVIASTSLKADQNISFNGGTHQDLVKLKYQDFEDVVHPKVIACAKESKSNMELATTLFACIEAGDFAQVKNLVAKDFVFSGPTPEPIGKEKWLAVHESITAAIPNFCFNISDIQEMEDCIRVTLSVSGTQKDQWDLGVIGMGVIQATGKSFQNPVEHAEIKFRNGKIVSLTIPDVGPEGGIAGILKQLGVERPQKG